jgi:hypothetical protein
LLRKLANASGRIVFSMVLFMDWQFVSGCFPPHLSMTQFPSITDSQPRMLRASALSGRDFHLTVGVHSQAHVAAADGCDGAGITLIHHLMRWIICPEGGGSFVV